MKTLRNISYSSINGRIPEVLLDYLCKLVQMEETTWEISLTSRDFGTGKVQDISCETVFGTVFRRVFGFQPVDARLKVCVTENQIELAIAG